MSYQTPRGFQGKVEDDSVPHQLRIRYGMSGSGVKVTCNCKRVLYNGTWGITLAEIHMLFAEHMAAVEGT